MFKEVKVNATFNDRTGYGIHASNFFPKLLELAKGEEGTVTISLLDTVTASQMKDFPARPSILYNVWESTEQPEQFVENVRNFNQLWVASEWQKAASIAQGIPEEKVKVVPEGVDPDVYKPEGSVPFEKYFRIVHVGQWQPRKSTEEICRAFIKAFPDEENVIFYLSADTIFPSDSYKSTEERLKAMGIDDPRIVPVHFGSRDEYIKMLQRAHLFVSCSRSEGWGLPIIEAMACFTGDTEVVANDIERTMVRNYSGELVVIELDDTIIEATPEHPFWTNKGWKLAKELDNDCQLLYCPNYGEQNNAAIYAGRIRDIESTLSIHYGNGIIEDNGAKLFVGAVEKTPTGINETIKEHSKVSSFGYKSAGFELSGRDYRWRGDRYVKENAPEKMEANDSNIEYVTVASGLASGEGKGSVDSCISEDECGNKKSTFIPILDSWDIPPSSLSGIGTSTDNQEKTYADIDTVLRDSSGAEISHPEYGRINESYIGNKGSKYKAIRSIRIKQAENIPVYNLKTQYGLYTANGYLVHNCGIPTTVCDWGGSTEYHDGAIKVPIKGLIKPFGIYGNWDVPGKWAEPDFDILALKMREVYESYDEYKTKALLASDKIRDKFSWQKAAEKGFFELKQLSDSYLTGTSFATNCETNTMANLSEDEIRQYALSHGWRINSMERERSIFVIGTWPNSQEKLETLIETIGQVKSHGFPVAVVTHYALPQVVADIVDYIIYEKKNVLSDDWRATYFRDNNGKIETAKSRIPYHGVACLNNMRNAIDYFNGKYDRMYYLEYDSEIDLDEMLRKTRASNKDVTFIKYEERGIRTDVWSGRIRYLHSRFPIINSWAEYTKGMTDINSEYVLEFWLKKYFPESESNIIEMDISNRFDQTDREVWPDDVFQLNFWNGPMLNIPGISRRVYDVNYMVDERVVFSLQQKVGSWSMANLKYYVPWTITASLDGVEKFRFTLDLTGKRVLIQMGSKALGDTIAWMPYVEEFRKKHNCHVICSGWWQEIFDYPEIEFIKPGTEVRDVTAAYYVGCFDDQLDKNPKNWREVPLQRVAADILGLEYEPIRTKLKIKDVDPMNLLKPEKPYFCFSEFSTMRNKQWNRDGAWQKVIDEIKEKHGLEAVSISAEPSQLVGVTKHNCQGIHQTIMDVMGCEFYIGLNHGPSWIAYALGKPVIMITGVSEAWNDFPNPYRIAINNDLCGIGCFNDVNIPIDRGWEWCPRGKNYACTREITEEMVMEKIRLLLPPKEVSDAGENDKTSEREVSG